MRFVYLAMCAAALVGCSDGKSAIQSKHPLAPTDPTSQPPESPLPTGTLDSRTLADRVEGMFTTGLARVSLPPDGFSQSSDAVHPDVACVPSGWNGSRCWLMYTPYRNSDPEYENPAFLQAVNDTSWATPAQVINPLVPYPGIGYNSDPDHAYDPATGRMVQVYRVVSDSFNKIMIMSTANARQWTKPALAFKEKNHDAISPALVLESDRTAKLWYVRAGLAGCNASTSSVELRSAVPDSDSRYEHSGWTSATPVTMAIPGYVVWHLDVIELPNGQGYLALVAAYQRTSNCANSDLWLASSADGVLWRTYAMPILWRTMKVAKQRALSTWYRGTLKYDDASDSLDLWPSGLAKTNWSVYHVRVKLSDALDLLRAAQPTDFRPVSSMLPTHAVAFPMP